MKKLIVVSVLVSLSLCANAYVQKCYYGKDCVNGEVVKTCDSKCQARRAARKAARKAALKKSQNNKVAAQQKAAALQAQKDAAAAAAKKAQQDKDAAALAAIGKVQEVGDEISVVLNNDILFKYGKADLSKNSKQTLNRAVELLNQIPNRSLVIQGHTDSSGSAEFNMELSEKRAKSVYDYMMSQGLNIKNVTYKGYGETKPVADNGTQEGRMANRRVEFIIK